MTKYICPDNGEEYWTIGDLAPSQILDIGKFVNVKIMWFQNRSLSELMFILKKIHVDLKTFLI